MIYEELKNLISRVRNDDTVEIFDNAVSLFNTMDEDNYMSIFEATLNSSPGLTDTEIIDELIEDLHLLVDNLGAIQGVTLNDESRISDKITIIKALSAVFDYSDKVAILNIAKSDDSAEERLSDIIAMVSDMESEKVFINLASVSDGVMSRIEELLDTPSTQDEEVVDFNTHLKSIVDKYIKFKERLLDKKPFYVDKYLLSTATIGMCYEDYISDLFKHSEFKSLVDKLDTVTQLTGEQTYDLLSKYLIGVAILSIDAQADLLSIIKSNIELITNNIKAINNLDTYLSKNTLKLSSAGDLNE